MAKDIRDKPDVECKFYQSAEDVPDPRELFQAAASNNRREREFHLSVSPRPEEP